jgi:AmmeMemoRadiSam system protein B/AmmeMemoRadiSam system protein A
VQDENDIFKKPQLGVLSWPEVPMKLVTLFTVLLSTGIGCSEQKPSPRGAAETAVPEAAPVARPPTVEQRPQTAQNAFKSQVAGPAGRGFYPDDPAALRAQINGFLAAAETGHMEAERDVVGILAPHAGFRYSGPVAGEAYRVVQGRDYRTVVILALSHRQTANKAALLDRPAYETPLGPARINTRLVRRLTEGHGDLFEVNEAMFNGEHSLEVQLPFIQVALPKADIVPIVVAVQNDDKVARIGAALYKQLGGRRDILFAISSDLSHYFPYDEAVSYDLETLGLLEQWKIDEWNALSKTRRGMCGSRPMLTFIKLFENYSPEKRRVKKISYKNSGDTAGDKSRVVGYGALAFSVEQGMRKTDESEKEFGPFTAEDRRELMGLAKQAVESAATGKDLQLARPRSPRLQELGAAFVTLKKQGQLRGCIGHVIARVPLFKCVLDVARSAAVHDSRFPPVSASELGDLTYEISVLTAPEPTTPEEVVVGRDGLIMSRGPRSGLLLPQVPLEWHWDRTQFLDATCRKAGLPKGCWQDSETEIKSFRAIVWGEADLD